MNNMKLPKKYFENLSASKYREYLKLLPDMHQENTKMITMLIFTFVAMIFFGVFAIKPTLETIIELRKQLDDSEFVLQQLQTKMSNLSNLQQQYNQLNNDLPFVYDAIPQTAEVPLLVGQIEAIAKKNNLSVVSLRISQVDLTAGQQIESVGSSFIFTLEVEGTYENITAFSKSLAHFNRIVNIESIGLRKDPKQDALVLQLRGREYFKK